ncbi:hypothetical protein B484DRAFT_450162 [Ochromonadaceae sp. CCMP2298]|nr:hypothetical protein B484DRAFT_450162 [Ochromonadaceae sp. CCMP2298]|mmetsp:Transcript_21412/g.47546  ORF Transcript_21412/g.47546 Transcript_21412/m.47546 type:complete len:194 (+) Transcript_21412:211-792(+)
MFSRIASFPKTHPFAFGVVITAAKTGGVDALIQYYVEKKERLDLKRLSTFFIFGAVFSGAWQYALFVKIMPRVIPGAFAFAAKPIREKIKDLPGMKGVLQQCFVENGINNPVLYFPCFYMIKEFLNGKPLINGIHRYRKNCYEDIPAIWAVWVPAQLINFSFSPPWFRVPFVAVVSCLWTAYVSYTRGDAAKD